MADARMRILIWGAGGHGKVVADVVRASGHEFVGYVDRDAAKATTVVDRGRNVAFVDQASFIGIITADKPLPCDADAVVVAVGDNAVRQRCIRMLGRHAAPALVHPTCAVSPTARLDCGTVVMPTAVVNADAAVGVGVIINTGAIVEHDCIIGECAHISPGAVLSGGVEVGELAWIGAGASLLPLVKIGRGSRVGAGAVVLSDVDEDTTVAGVPARPLGPSTQVYPTRG